MLKGLGADASSTLEGTGSPEPNVVQSQLEAQDDSGIPEAAESFVDDDAPLTEDQMWEIYLDALMDRNRKERGRGR